MKQQSQFFRTLFHEQTKHHCKRMKRARDQIVILILLLIAMQVASFFVMWFAQRQMNDQDGLFKNGGMMMRFQVGDYDVSTTTGNSNGNENQTLPSEEHHNPRMEKRRPHGKKQRGGSFEETASNIRYDRTLMFLHIGKNGGTSFDSVGKKVAREAKYNYVGDSHFDWNQIHKQGQVGTNVEVVMLLRHPVSRSVSHFYFYKNQVFAKNTTIQGQDLQNYLFGDNNKQNLLDTRDIWQDGQAAVSWLTGTHIGKWVGCPKSEVETRERRALNTMEMIYLATERLQQVKWFGILEDLGRSMELLQHEFQLRETPKMGHVITAIGTGGNPEPTAAQVKALKSLMPQDLWVYEYGKRLFEARWQAYKTGKYEAPKYPPFPDISCVSTRVELNCTSGPFVGEFRGQQMVQMKPSTRKHDGLRYRNRRKRLQE